MDTVTTLAGRALAAGDPLAALNLVALRNDPDALALRGIAMAQLGDLSRARTLLRRAARAFGPDAPADCARCHVAEAEVALVARDLGGWAATLDAAVKALTACGDHANAAHAGYLAARRWLVLGQLDAVERTLADIDVSMLRAPSRAGYWLVVCGVAMRRVRAAPARAAVADARQAARTAGISALVREVERTGQALQAPVGRMIERGRMQLLDLAGVEALLATDTLVVDACRHAVRAGTASIALARRPVLFALVRLLADAWPGDTTRERLIERAFRIRHADASMRARLRVEIGRLRKALAPIADINTTRRGFSLTPRHTQAVAVLEPPEPQSHAQVRALLADGATWSSADLALALGTSTRTVQRALADLTRADAVTATGRGRSRRWMMSSVPGFPTTLLLPMH